MNTVLNVGLDPRVVGDAAAPSKAFPTVDAAQVKAGLEKAAAELASLGLGFETCLLDRSPKAEEKLRACLSQKHYDIILFGGGVRLEPSMTPLFEKLINIARTDSPSSVLCFNTGPDAIVEAVRRWWPLQGERSSPATSNTPAMKLASVRIITKDVRRLTEFYERALATTSRWLNEEFAEVATPTCAVAIGSERTMAMFGAGAAHAADNRSVILEFLVPDVDKDCERLEGYLSDVVQRPVTQPWGNRSFLFRDPDGNLINLFTPIGAEARSRYGL